MAWTQNQTRAEHGSSAEDRPVKRRPFSDWVKRIANFKGEGGHSKKPGLPLTSAKNRKNAAQNSSSKKNKYSSNNPYSQSTPVRPPSLDSSANGQLSFATGTSHHQRDNGSLTSLPLSALQERDGPSNSNRSAAPTLATDPETINSDAGQSKAPTTATGAGALSSIDGAGGDSTFSSPNHSDRSLTTTLTTVQSQSATSALHTGSAPGPTTPTTFSHQYPVAPSGGPTISAIPRHIADSIPQNYSTATANNLLSDNASLLTLASSSKRRRRSMDTDASVRAIPPSSVWGGSRESLPLSVLSSADPSGALYAASRPSIGGLNSAERASIYSAQGVAAPALASERNSSYYASKSGKDPTDAKSLRSLGGVDARSQADASSLRGGYEGSVRSAAFGGGHARNDSLGGGGESGQVRTAATTPLASPGLSGSRQTETLSRRNSDFNSLDEREKVEPGKGKD